MADELSAPLGGKQSKPAPNPARKPALKSVPHIDARNIPFARIAFSLVALILTAAALRIVLVHDPLGGRPVAETTISNATSNQIANDVTAEAETPPETEITPLTEGGTGESSGPSIITVDESVPDATDIVDTASLEGMGVLPDLLEETQLGAIPAIGADGSTPFTSYARASVGIEAAGGRPLVAIVFTGMGLSESGTLDAIRQLPENITLAFAPYGDDLPLTVGAARAEGHEVMLEIPLEPFDYPENDPGPHTLLTSQPPRANLEKLFWLMARFGGYIGVINYMGARFTSAAGDFTPVMEELASRGLGYLDDGSSNRSLAAQLAASNDVPYARANMQLDGNPSRAAILNALAELEEKARSNGSAIGVASALPVSINTVSDWARELEDSDLLLVPASALMQTGD